MLAVVAMVAVVVLVATAATVAVVRAAGRRPRAHIREDRIQRVMRSPHH
ncbi:hypothetical protein [Streptomyces sp. NPDC006668]